MTVVVAGDRVFIVDAGAGSGRRFGELRLPWANVEAVFLTHFHSDHIDGLGEVLLQHWAAGGAQAPMPIHGPDGVGQVVAGFGTFRDVITAKTPVTNANSLTQDDVIVIAVWADASARCCEADHKVVDAPARDTRHVPE